MPLILDPVEFDIYPDDLDRIVARLGTPTDYRAVAVIGLSGGLTVEVDGNVVYYDAWARDISEIDEDVKEAILTFNDNAEANWIRLIRHALLKHDMFTSREEAYSRGALFEALDRVRVTTLAVDAQKRRNEVFEGYCSANKHLPEDSYVTRECEPRS